jgi:hypothetical protein
MTVPSIRIAGDETSSSGKDIQVSVVALFPIKGLLHSEERPCTITQAHEEWGGCIGWPPLNHYLAVGGIAGVFSFGVLVPVALVFFLASLFLFFNLSALAASIALSAGGSATSVFFAAAAAFAALASFSLFLCFAVVSAAEGLVAATVDVGVTAAGVSAAMTDVVNGAVKMIAAMTARLLFIWESSGIRFLIE